MTIDSADLDFEYELTFTREEIAAAEWDLAFIEGLEFQDEQRTNATFLAIRYEILRGGSSARSPCASTSTVMGM